MEWRAVSSGECNAYKFFLLLHDLVRVLIYTESFIYSVFTYIFWCNASCSYMLRSIKIQNLWMCFFGCFRLLLVRSRGKKPRNFALFFYLTLNIRFLLEWMLCDIRCIWLYLVSLFVRIPKIILFCTEYRHISCSYMHHSLIPFYGCFNSWINETISFRMYAYWREHIPFVWISYLLKRWLLL